MELNAGSLKNKWQGVEIPSFDYLEMAKKTAESPIWVHFGAGNIFRGFIAELQHRLLEDGLSDRGITAVETFDFEIIDKIYTPHDNLAILVGLKPDGTTQNTIIASIAQGLKGSAAFPEDFSKLEGIFSSPSLQIASFTITEKGYSLTDLNGKLLPVVSGDINEGFSAPKHTMSIVTKLLHVRFLAGAHPVSMVSMDNCSHNGDKLRNAVLDIAKGWLDKGLVTAEFVAYLSDTARVGFPWSMIDKITPRPAAVIQKQLEGYGITGIEPLVTSKNTFIAPFVNAEIPQYLVIEDIFPNGRPPLEKAGVYFADRDTVNNTEKMKVTTCLNPLHTALAVFGCLLGYNSIADEMKDADLCELVKRIGYTEGLPVVVDPGIISPKAFIDEVINERLPNPFIPDAPQRIATDTSQKLPIRFGETIKSYHNSQTLETRSLVCIPLAIAAWCRYLLGVDDRLAPMEISSDPMLAQLQDILKGVKAGEPASYKQNLMGILANINLFAVDLYEVGLGEKIEDMFAEMLADSGAVRKTLQKYLSK